MATQNNTPLDGANDQTSTAYNTQPHLSPINTQYVVNDLVDRTDSSESSGSSWDLLQSEPVTVVDLGTDDKQTGYVVATDNSEPRGEVSSEKDFMEKMKAQIVTEVGGQVWSASKDTARRFYDVYGNIDILRPYFDVEPKDVIKRLTQSLVPKKPVRPQTVPAELYGPLMVIFTLVALLLFSMKSSGHTVQEGTLMGTAVGICFGYWLGGSAFYYFLSYLCNTHITPLQILTLMGYSMFSHCVVILLSTLGPHDSHSFFYLLWLVFGGLSGLKLIGVFMSRTWSKKHGLVVGCIVTVCHLLFLIYLHFAFHAVYEDHGIILSRTNRDITISSSTKQDFNVLTQTLTETR